MKNPHEILGVKKNATFEEIKDAFRGLVKIYHPDVNNGSIESHEKMVEINAAYEFLHKEYVSGIRQKQTTSYQTYTKEQWDAYYKAYKKAEYESMGNKMKAKVARNLEPIRQENLNFQEEILKARNYNELLKVSQYYCNKFEDMIKTMYDYVQKRHRYGMPPNYVFGEEKEKDDEIRKQKLGSIENLTFLQVNSTYISAFAYDEEKQVLFVKFNSEAIFAYFNVANTEYSNLINAPSVGSYFAKNIRDCYDYEKIID